MAKPIQQAIEVVRQAKTEVNKLLSAPETNHNLLEINSHFTRIETRLSYMGGILEPEAKTKSTGKRFPPITTFMGAKLETSKPITNDDLTPGEERRKKFIGRVNKLWNEISNFNPETILTSYRIETDVMILRGVAKRAGIKDYESRELTTEFVTDIQAAVEKKKKETGKQKEIDRNVKGDKSKNNKQNDNTLNPPAE
jgi:hypothetical protein